MRIIGSHPKPVNTFCVYFYSARHNGLLPQLKNHISTLAQCTNPLAAAVPYRLQYALLPTQHMTAAAPAPAHWPQLAAALATLPLPVAVVDLETTGGHFEQDRVTEVAILRFEQGHISRHQWLVNPQQPISAFITRLTGISNEMVADAPVFADIAPTLLPLLQGHILVAHNSRFDYTFLRREFARAGHAFAAPSLCTVQLSRKLYPEHNKHNLDSLIERFGLNIAATERHRALGDVLALTDFLDLSLQQNNAQSWLAYWPQLTKPHWLPTWLPEHLRQQLYRLPDSAGLSVWHHPGHHTPTLLTHEHAFSQIAGLLQLPGAADRWQHTGNIRFIPALSLLHAHALKAEYLQTHPAAPQAAAWYTAAFVADHHGRLQARVVPLSNGLQSSRPYGLFAHPRAAKKALAEWAREHSLCPAILDIGGQGGGLQTPCPVAAAQLCSGDCRLPEHIQQHNQAVLQAAPLLPVLDWGTQHALKLTEFDPLSGQTITLHCAAAAIEMADGQWYFDDALPRLFKQRLKNRSGIEVVC